jgi:16S rRNA (adenine1518-N6/adenine1519-N6)-dimethyltransferase
VAILAAWRKGPSVIRSQSALLRAHGIRPVKRRGQNFLLDANIAQAIAAEILALGQDVVELGAGAGALTGPLLAGQATVTAIEVDRHLCAVLREEFGVQPGLRLVEADLSRLDWGATLAAAGPLPVVAGNLPYLLTSVVLFALAEQRARVAGAVLMMQREVADRLCAAPGGRSYGVLAALLGAVFTARMVRTVPPTVFWPRPEVASAVVRLIPVTEDWPEPEWQRYVATVKALFGQRRKKVGTLLRSRFGLTAAQAVMAAERAGIDPDARPETLPVARLRALAAGLPEPGAGGDA